MGTPDQQTNYVSFGTFLKNHFLENWHKFSNILYKMWFLQCDIVISTFIGNHFDFLQQLMFDAPVML